MIASYGTHMDAAPEHMDAAPEHTAGLLKQIHEAGRGVMAMKLFGGGRNAEPGERRKSLEWVLGLGAVDSLTIGFTSPQQIDQILDLIEDIEKERG